MKDMEKTFGDIMVGDKLYCSDLACLGHFMETRIVSMELDENALRDMDHRVPDVIITTQDFQITINKLHLTHFKNKVIVNENGLYISPSPKYLTEALIKEVNSKIEFWQKRGERIVEAYNSI
jgi:hypothetical protein